MTNAVRNRVKIPERAETPIIINGDMQIAQRGTSTTDVGSTEGYITVDRFNFNQNGNPSARFTVTQDSDVPSGYGFAKSSKVDCTTAQTSLGSDDFLTIEQRLEGQNLQVLKKGTSNAEYLTIAFWVKSTKTGTYILEIRDIDNNRLITSTYTISSAGTWEKKVISFVGDTTGTLDNDNAHSIQIAWCLFAGTDFTSGTQRTTWASRTNADRFVNQGVNLADSTDNNFFITGIQAEVGDFNASTIPPFQFEDRGTSLERCKRYCMVVGSGDADYQNIGVHGLGIGSTIVDTIQPLHPPMRVEPSMSNSGGLQASNGSSGFAATAIAITTVSNSRQSAGIRLTVGSGISAGSSYRIEQQNSSTSVVTLDAEI